MTDYYAYDAGLPCKNPHCHSEGRPHPNCKCYSGMGADQYAKGGSVCSQGMPHDPSCEYYAPGGAVNKTNGALEPQSFSPDDVPNTLGMSAVHNGLLGMLKDVGHSKLSDPDSHHQKLHAMRNEPNAEKHVELMHGHPLTSGVSKANLKPILNRMNQPLQTLESNPAAMRSSVQYLDSSMRGEQALDHQMKGLLGMQKVDSIKADPESRKELKAHLQSIQEHPEQMLNIGGSLGDYLPEHTTGLAYQSAQAVQYLNSIKPKPQKLAPLDTDEGPDAMEEEAYDRQLDIAQKPLLVLQSMREGMLQPQDLKTVQTIYPGLYKSMVKKATEQLIEAEAKEFKIPYVKRQGLSDLMGQPMDYTQTPQAAMAVMMSSATPPPPSQQASGKKGAKAKAVSSTEYKAIEKSDSLSETSLEARQIDKRTH